MHALAGKLLSDEQAAILEAKLRVEPDDLTTRVTLLGKYTFEQFGSPESERARFCHIRWIVQNRPNEPNYGNAIQSAHTTLGRIALRNGDIAVAKFHLIQSAIGAASPQTTSFGPDLVLAELLLGMNEKEAVLDYLDRCKLFCDPTHRSMIDLRVRVQFSDIAIGSDETAECLVFEQARREIESEQLALEPEANRDECIRKCINYTERTIKLWTKRERCSNKLLVSLLQR